LLPIRDVSSEAEARPEPLTYRALAPLFDHSAAMRAVRWSIEQVADTDATVLVRGESGVGKELVAKAIHAASLRRSRPFVKVNCAALPAELLESELFGHEKGAFTGAYRRKLGKFEIADTGTIFLDEIGDMPLGLQAKLLHVLQDHEFARVGGSDVIRVDVRVVASTNRNLETAVAGAHFREDLYYRLKVVTLAVPPLRARREEIPLLARAFVARFNAQWRRSVTLSAESLQLLSDYGWPGNVRELENMMKRVVVLQREELLREELGGATAADLAAAPAPRAAPPTKETLRDLARRAAIDAQREAIRDVLTRVNWNRAEAARVLNISYKALLYKIDQCGLGRKRPLRRAGADDLSA
jgi:two-component system response regulator AtoC